MLTAKEKWTGELRLDTQSGLLYVGVKQQIPLTLIEDAAVCTNAVVRFGKRDVDKGARSALLCLRMKAPVAQPGRLTPMKGHNLTLRLENDVDANAVLEALDLEKPAQWSNAEFPIDKCIVEAKRGCCDYIRGGTVGSNPYGKAGLVSPIITPEVDLAGGTVVIRYLGVNSRGRESVWFSAHPADAFSFAAADDVVYALSLRENSCKASIVYQCMDIERDENAKGLWYVSFETEFDSVCDGARWLAALQAAAAGTFAQTEAGSIEPREISRTKAVAAEPSAPRAAYDTAMLLAAVDLLHAAGVLTEEEWHTKRETVKEKEEHRS